MSEIVLAQSKILTDKLRQADSKGAMDTGAKNVLGLKCGLIDRSISMSSG